MKTIKLQIEAAEARRIHRTASPEVKAILESSAPCGFFSGNVMDRIKSYEDACAELGIDPMDIDAMLRSGFRKDEIARRKIETITEALNEGTILDWFDDDQKKWFPWFDASAGFAFCATLYLYSSAYAGMASRLCFKNDELATYAGRTFADLYKEFMTA